MKTLCGLVSLLALAGSVMAQDCCERCDRCGQTGACCKTCRLVPATKKVSKTNYHCECEDFCVPGPSTRTVCFDECGKRKIVYTPTCGEVRTRKKLVKKDESKEVPITKCVVERLCPACAACCDDALADQAAGADQMSTALAEGPRQLPAEAPSAAAPANSEPRAVTAAKTEFNRLLTLWRK